YILSAKFLRDLREFFIKPTIEQFVEEEKFKKEAQEIKDLGITDDLKKFNKSLIEYFDDLKEIFKTFEEDLKNINLENFYDAISGFRQNLLETLLTPRFQTKEGIISVEDLLKREMIYLKEEFFSGEIDKEEFNKFFLEVLSQYSKVWRGIVLSIELHNQAIEKAIELVKEYFNTVFKEGELFKRYLEEIKNKIKPEKVGKSFTTLVLEDLSKISNLEEDIKGKFENIFKKLEGLKINIGNIKLEGNFEKNIEEFIEKIKKQLKEKIVVNLDINFEDLEKEKDIDKRIDKIRTKLNTLLELKSPEQEKKEIIESSFETLFKEYKGLLSKEKPSVEDEERKKRIEFFLRNFFSTESEILPPIKFKGNFNYKEIKNFKEGIIKDNKKIISLENEINELVDDYNKKLQEAKFNLEQISNYYKKIFDIQEEFNQKTTSININLIDAFIKKLENRNRELKLTLSFMKDLHNKLSKKQKGTIQDFEKEVKNKENEIEFNNEIISQIKQQKEQLEGRNNIQQAFSKYLEGDDKKLLDFNKHLQGIDWSNLVPEDIIRKFLEALGLSNNEINKLIEGISDANGLTEEGIEILGDLMNKYILSNKELYELRKKLIDEEEDGKKKILSLDMLINQVEKDNNLTLKERKELLKDLYDTQISSIGELDFDRWGEIFNSILKISDDINLSLSQKLDLGKRLLEEAKEEYDLTGDIYSLEQAINLLLEKKLIKGRDATKAMKELYETEIEYIRKNNKISEQEKIKTLNNIAKKIKSDKKLTSYLKEGLLDTLTQAVLDTDFFKEHIDRMKQGIAEEFKNFKLFDIYRVITPKAIFDYIQRYFRQNKLTLNIDFKSESFKNLVKELGNTVVEVFKNKIEELKGIISELRSKYGLQQEESDEDKLKRLYEEGVIDFSDYSRAQMAIGNINTIKTAQEQGMQLPFAEQNLKFNQQIVSSVLEKAEKKLEEKRKEIEDQQKKINTDFNTAVNNFNTAVNNFNTAVNTLISALANLGSGGGGGGTTKETKTETKQTTTTTTTNNNTGNFKPPGRPLWVDTINPPDLGSLTA
ncbi:MAG: hypothetical protein ACPL1F_00235, partial [bacterium]